MSSFVSASSPNYKLFLVIFGGIGAVGLASTLASCLTSRCFEACQIKRKRVHGDVELALPPVTRSTATSSDSTMSQNELDAQNAVLTQRVEHLLENDIYFGTEAQDYAKRVTKSLGCTIVLPILSTKLSRTKRRSLSSEKGSDSQVVNAVEATDGQGQEDVLEGNRVE